MRGYSLGDAARILKVSRGRLDHWRRTNLVRPSVEAGADLVSLRSLLGLLDRGLSMSQIRRSLELFKQTMPEVEQPMRTLRVWTEGSERVVLNRGGKLIEPSGQIVIDFDETHEHQDLRAPARLVVAEPQSLNSDPLGVGLRHTKGDARKWFERGCGLDSRASTYADAVEAYLRAIELDPEFADAHCNLGSLYFNRNRRATAKVCFERALQIDADHVEANLNLAIVLEDEGRDRKALSHYKRALAADPLCADTQVSLALLYEKLGLQRKAFSHWRRYLQLDPAGPWSDVARMRLEN